MVNTTPLLLLLDGILEQDEVRIGRALQQIERMVPLPSISESPLRSARSLEEIVKTLMSFKPDYAQIASDSDGSLPLHFAASIGNVRVAALLLEKFQQAASTPNNNGKIPLHYAAREGRTKMVEFILRVVPHTAAILSKKGKLALQFACGEGHLRIVQALLKTYPEGAILRTKKGKMAIHFAARWGHLAIVKELYRLYPQCASTRDYEGSLPLHDAARQGQLETSKFLCERYPEGLRRENIRGETPLFPAVRNGSMDLCVYLVKAWPKGGQHVLQRVRKDDDVHDWDAELVDLCLRGAVDNFSDCTLSKGTAVSSHKSLHTMGDDHVSPNEPLLSGASTPPPRIPSVDLEINIPRSKSPILEEGCERKKRSSSYTDEGHNKRPRRGSHDGGDPLSTSVASQRIFYQLHAAIICGASPSVLESVLKRCPEQLGKEDELGRLPLHLAVEHGSNKEQTDLIIDRIWKPYKEACSQRDYLGRLPLHVALMNRADCRVVEVLLETNPSAGVEQCDVVDSRFRDMMPLHVANEHRCDLSTIYLLLRGDPSEVSTWQ